MAHASYQNLIQRVLADDAFAAQLAGDPPKALQSAGVTPTPELLDARQGVDVVALRGLASSFKEDQAAAG